MEQSLGLRPNARLHEAGMRSKAHDDFKVQGVAGRGTGSQEWLSREPWFV